jgi:hypothetical protein
MVEDFRKEDPLFDLTASGARSLLRRLADRTGVEDVYPHRRSSPADRWLLRK